MSSSPISIRELRQQAGPVAAMFVIHAQLEAAFKKTTKTGNPYYELRFADAEETLVLRIWDNSPMFPTCEQLQRRKFYELSGEFGLGNDGKSIDSRRWEVRELNEDESAQVLAGSEELREKQQRDFQFIEETTGHLSDPRLRALCSLFLEKHSERFRRTGAARDYHHARRGGLVEHVAQMMRAAVQVCEAYEFLNRDLLVAGVLFHDVGKLWENAYTKDGFSMPYTEVSELIGHIPMGMEIVNKLWREILEDEAMIAGWRELDPPSEKVRLHLLHLIASHHGELAFGSPTVPKTPEAQALHYIDNLDAKMEMFERGYMVAAELGKNVYERVHPLPGKLVQPLGKFEAEEAESEAADFEEEENEVPSQNPLPETGKDIDAEPESDLQPMPVVEVKDAQILPHEEKPIVPDLPDPNQSESENDPKPVSEKEDDGLPIPAPPDDIEPEPF